MYLSDYLCIGYIILNNNSNSDKNIHNFRYFTLILTHIISHVSTRHVRFRICWKCLVWRSLYCTVCKDDFCAKTIFVQRRLFVVHCYAMAYTLVSLRPVSWIPRSALWGLRSPSAEPRSRSLRVPAPTFADAFVQLNASKNYLART
jgi:hypothetical protein